MSRLKEHTDTERIRKVYKIGGDELKAPGVSLVLFMFSFCLFTLSAVHALLYMTMRAVMMNHGLALALVSNFPMGVCCCSSMFFCCCCLR